MTPDATYLTGIIERIERRAHTAQRNVETGHPGITGITALREIRLMASDAMTRHEVGEPDVSSRSS